MHKFLKELVLRAKLDKWISGNKGSSKSNIARQKKLNGDLLRRHVQYLLFEERAQAALISETQEINELLSMMPQMFEDSNGDEKDSGFDPRQQDCGGFLQYAACY